MPWRLRRCVSVAHRASVEALERRALRAAVAPPVAPIGPEFRVNTNTAGSQEFFSEAPHAVAASAGGDFVVVWSSSGQDGSSWGVYGQQYDADGAPRGAEFRVNETSSNSQWYPTVAADDAGDFVVAWTSYFQDGSQSGVYARRYDAAGEPQGGEFAVNTTTVGDQRHASVAADADGDFVIVWAGASLGGTGWDIYGQRYSAAGARRGGEFRVNGTTGGDQQYAAVAVDADGDFVVTWTGDGQDGSGTAVFGRRYDAGGAAQGSEFRVNTFTAGNQQYARVAADRAGDFVVAWASAGQDGSGRGVYAQRYAASGAKLGDEFRVNEATAGEQFAPTVAAGADGGFVVTWTTAAQDGDLFGVFGRAYDAAGEPAGGEFRVNTTVAGNQVYSSVAADGAGGYVAAWQSDRQDGSFFGIYAQRFAPPAAVVGRHLFYNGSSFDGDTPGADPADDGAIAPDKVALLEGQPAALAPGQYSGYGRGINGIMVDVARLGARAGAVGVAGAEGGGDGLPVPLSAADFALAAGSGGDPAGWAAAPAPLSVTVRPGAGTGGSDRVTLVWADGAVRNQWLRVTVRAGERTRLVAPDVFYFGNLVGDTGDGAGDETAAVTAMDAVLVRRAFSEGPVPLSSPFDLNRDGRVNRWDMLLVRRGMADPSSQLAPPVAPAAAAAAASDSSSAPVLELAASDDDALFESYASAKPL
jgi:hypothetical protein